MKSLFPEAEVTKSLSRNNLFKGYYTNLQEEEVRVINTNELMEKRMEEWKERLKQASTDGFSQGLQPDVVEALMDDEENPGNVIKAEPVVDEESVQAAHEEAEQILAKARENAEIIISQARMQAESESRKTMEIAREQGLAQGMQEAAQEAKKQEQELNRYKRELEAEYQRQIDVLEPQFVETITGIYEHIFGVDLQSNREILLHLIAATLRKAEDNRSFIIHVSKEDYPYVSMQKKQVTAGIVSGNSSVEVIEDMTLAKNECLIETDGGIFDCGLGTQLSELRKNLLLLSYEKR